MGVPETLEYREIGGWVYSRVVPPGGEDGKAPPPEVVRRSVEESTEARSDRFGVNQGGTMRRTALLTTVIALAVLGWPTPTRGASAGEQTSCRFEHDITLSPGFAAQPGSGTFTTGGEIGTMDCNGPVNGQQPAGTGTEGVTGRYGVKSPNSCASAITGDGDGIVVFNMTIPTSGGDQKVTASGTFTFGRKLPTQGGLVAGTFQTDHYSGTFELTPIEGDCVTKPVTKAHVWGDGVLH